MLNLVNFLTVLSVNGVRFLLTNSLKINWKLVIEVPHAPKISIWSQIRSWKLLSKCKSALTWIFQYLFRWEVMFSYCLPKISQPRIFVCQLIAINGRGKFLKTLLGLNIDLWLRALVLRSLIKNIKALKWRWQHQLACLELLEYAFARETRSQSQTSWGLLSHFFAQFNPWGAGALRVGVHLKIC